MHPLDLSWSLCVTSESVWNKQSYKCQLINLSLFSYVQEITVCVCVCVCVCVNGTSNASKKWSLLS